MNKKRWVKIGVGIVFILLIINIIGSLYFYDLAIKREKKDFLQGNKDLEVSAEAMNTFLKGDWREWVVNQNFEGMEIESFDGLKLQGYFLESIEPTNKTVIFAHGYLGRGRDMALYGQYYYEELGYNIFLADMRGHGESEGDYIGFGWHDRLDYLKWIDTIIEKKGMDVEIVLHGLSMGGATMAMISGEELPSNVKAIVADSPYSSVYDLFAYQLKRMYKLPEFPVLPTTSLVTNMKAGYSLKEASALEQVKKAEVPILYFHGSNDTFVPTPMANELYEQTNGETDIMFFEGANHGEAFAIDKEKYVEKLTGFLKKYIN
ncbi:alpha/beta hydrolase [Salirhabdus salicampi]|uniref:alpha/beta hydrolase n=1 Tax=Salirhabdus salicampi TaxID=476102 RepID=UPI0020C28DA0|nr:alpha/beta hydrolase [Salirhabdus salicampi]MCP8615942.1 alpha/beta hydrolase [Salirhabdus salicampi]